MILLMSFKAAVTIMEHYINVCNIRWVWTFGLMLQNDSSFGIIQCDAIMLASGC